MEKALRPDIVGGITVEVPQIVSRGGISYIVYLDELPWYDITNKLERNRTRNKQWMRMWYKTQPGYYSDNTHGNTTENVKRFRERNPNNHNESMKRYRKTPKGWAHAARMKATSATNAVGRSMHQRRRLLGSLGSRNSWR